MGLHFLDPLRHETLGGDDQHPLHQPTELQFPEDQPRFDGLAQADFIGQQVANPVAGHGTGESVKLVRQRDDASFERSQQHVLGQGVGDPGGGHGVADAVEALCLKFSIGSKRLSSKPLHRRLARNPHLINRPIQDRST